MSTTSNQNSESIHTLLNDMCQEWSQRQWGGIDWSADQWYDEIQHVLPYIAHYAHPWQSHMQFYEISSMPTSMLAFLKSIGANTLKWLSVLHHYQAHSEGLLNKFFDDMSRSVSMARAWQQSIRMSLPDSIVQHSYHYAQHLSQEAQAYVQPLLKLWLHAPIDLYNHDQLSSKQHKLILVYLYNTYHDLGSFQEFPRQSSVLYNTEYSFLWEACTSALQAHWAEAHLNLSQCQMIDPKVQNMYDQALKALQHAIKHGIGHLEKQPRYAPQIDSDHPNESMNGSTFSSMPISSSHSDYEEYEDHTDHSSGSHTYPSSSYQLSSSHPTHSNHTLVDAFAQPISKAAKATKEIHDFQDYTVQTTTNRDSTYTVSHAFKPSHALIDQTPLPQAGMVVGYYEWRLEGRLSTLNTCRTWKARRRKGSIYKKAAVKWSRPVQKLQEQNHESLAADLSPVVSLVQLDQSMYAQFMQRGKTWQQHQLTQFVPILEFGWDAVRARVCIVEELLEGPSLYEAHRHKPLTVQQLIHISKKLVMSLMYLHHQNLYHGNIKPENVVWHKGDWYWTDAHLLLDQPIGGSQEARKRSQLFMAPEQKLSAAADLYAMGMMLKELMASVQSGSDEEYAFMNHLMSQMTQTQASDRGKAELYIDGWGKAPPSYELRMHEHSGSIHLYHHQLCTWLREKMPGYQLAHLADSTPKYSRNMKAKQVTNSSLPEQIQTRQEQQWISIFSQHDICYEIQKKNREYPKSILQLCKIVENHQNTSNVMNLTNTDVQALSYWYLPGPHGYEQEQIHFVLIPEGVSALGKEYGLDQPILMATTPITLGVWQAYMGAKEGMSQNTNTPVESVHFIEAQNFCYQVQKHISAYNTSTCRLQSRLPTVSEWTYSALAGQIGEYAGYDTPYDTVCSLEKSKGSLSAVAQLKANSWGLYDMSGLVWEWLLEYPTQPQYIQKPNTVFKKHPNKERFIGGGSWIDSAAICSVLQPKKRVQSNQSLDQGFRIILQFTTDS